MVMVNEEVAKKTFAFTSKSAKLSLKVIFEIMLYLQNKNKTKNNVGKMSLKKLNQKDCQLANMPLSDNDVKGMRHSLKKLGIDFSVKKEIESFTVYFKARDIEQVEKALEKYTVKKFQKESLKEKISKAKEKVNEFKKDNITKEKYKSQDIGAL